MFLLTGPGLILAMGAATLLVARKTLAPAPQALLWGLSLATWGCQVVLATFDGALGTELEGSLPTQLLGIVGSALYVEGFRRRRGPRVGHLPILATLVLTVVALVILAALAPASPIRVAVRALGSALLLLAAAPMILTRGRGSSFSEWAATVAVLTFAGRELILVALAIGETTGRVSSDEPARVLAILTMAPMAAATSLIAFLVIASDFSARRRLLTHTDALTSVLNRLGFQQVAGAMFRRAQPLSVAIADIDHFKAINDRWGHAAGDMALACFAGRLAADLQPAEAIGRIGGEEFALVLDGAADTARERIEAMRRDLACLRVGGFPDLRLSASFGIAERVSGEPIEAVVARADAALYRAKQAGRNRTLTADLVRVRA